MHISQSIPRQAHSQESDLDTITQVVRGDSACRALLQGLSIGYLGKEQKGKG